MGGGGGGGGHDFRTPPIVKFRFSAPRDSTCLSASGTKPWRTCPQKPKSGREGRETETKVKGRLLLLLLFWRLLGRRVENFRPC